LFQGKKLSFYSGNLPQLYTLSLTSIMSCQVSKREESKREESKREMSEEKRAQCKKDKLKKGDDAIRVVNHQNNYNKLSVSEKCVVSMLVILIDLFSLSYNQVSFCLNI